MKQGIITDWDNAKVGKLPMRKAAVSSSLRTSLDRDPASRSDVSVYTILDGCAEWTSDVIRERTLTDPGCRPQDVRIW